MFAWWDRIVETRFRDRPILGNLVAAALWLALGALLVWVLSQSASVTWQTWVAVAAGFLASFIGSCVYIASLRRAWSKLRQDDDQRAALAEAARDFALGKVAALEKAIDNLNRHLSKAQTDMQTLASEFATTAARLDSIQSRPPRVEVNGYLEPTGKWVTDAWKLHLWFDFSCIPPGIPEQRRWERIKYTVNILGAEVIKKAQEDDFEVVKVGADRYRYTVPHDIPAEVGAHAASSAGHLLNPSIVVILDVARTPYGQINDVRMEFFVRIMNAPPEVVAWATKNDLISTTSPAEAPSPLRTLPAYSVEELENQIKARLERHILACHDLRLKVKRAAEHVMNVNTRNFKATNDYVKDANDAWVEFQNRLTKDLWSALDDPAIHDGYPSARLGRKLDDQDINSWSERLSALDETEQFLRIRIDTWKSHDRRLTFKGWTETWQN